jgi:hypothetical protein
MRPYLITAKLMRPSNMKRFPTPALDPCNVAGNTVTLRTFSVVFSLYFSGRLGHTHSRPVSRNWFHKISSSKQFLGDQQKDKCEILTVMKMAVLFFWVVMQCKL